MIIGITGTNGAGKGTVVEYLVEKHGFYHYSVREFILSEIDARHLPRNRDSMRLVANSLRQEHGSDYVAQGLLEKARAAGGNAIIESVRTLGEAHFLLSHHALLWGVDADRMLRYERAVLRGSDTDKVSFDEFCAQEDREMSSTAEWDMNVFGVLKLCDAIFTNNGSREELFSQIEEALKRLPA